MQLYSCDVNHAGNRDMQIHKAEVTAAEIVMLRAIHGAESLYHVTKTREDRRQHAKERDRLSSLYGAKLFATLFPGSMPRLPNDLADAGLNEDGREIEAKFDRAGEPEDEDAPVPEPSAAAKAIAARVAAKTAAPLA